MRARRIPAVLTVSAITAASLVASATADAAKRPHRPNLAREWAAYHGNRLRTGHSTSMPRFHAHLHVVKHIGLDGAVYASPIVARGLTIVATENDTVYAFGPRNRLVWKRHLGSPSPASQRPCGDIDPLGITGTPVFNRANGLVYVAPEFSGRRPTHRLYALHVGSGKVAFHRTLDLRGVAREAMQERGALTITHGRVWVPFGGLAGDCGQYKGRVVGWKLTGSGKPIKYTVPTAREAGIWAPPGPTVPRDGSLYVAVGNGASGVGDRYDHSDSVLRINGRARLTGSFSPTSWATDNEADLDLGSQGPAILRGKWVFIAGKSGTAYVLHARHLGGIGGEVSKRDICTSFGGTAVLGNTVYAPCTDGVKAIRIGPRGRMRVLWKADGSTTGSPVIGGGVVWALDTGSGVLHALGKGAGHSRASVSVGSVSRFATPALSGRRILVGTLSGLTIVSYR
jgi:hypothetical protein